MTFRLRSGFQITRNTSHSTKILAFLKSSGLYLLTALSSLMFNHSRYTTQLSQCKSYIWIDKDIFYFFRRTDIQLLCPNKPDIPIFTTIAPLAPINGNSDLLLKLGKIENEVATRKIAFAREPPFSYEHVVRPEFESLDERPTNNSKPSPVVS